MPLSLGGARSPSDNVAGAQAYLHAKFHLDPSNHLAAIHQRYGQTSQTGQRSDSMGRNVLQTLAQKLLTLLRAQRVRFSFIRHSYNAQHNHFHHLPYDKYGFFMVQQRLPKA